MKDRIESLESANDEPKFELEKMTHKARQMRGITALMFGAPREIVDEREVRVVLARESHELLLAALQEVYGTDGSATSSRSSLTWHIVEDTPMWTLHSVEISSEHARTQMRIAENRPEILSPKNLLSPLLLAVSVFVAAFVQMQIAFAPAVALGFTTVIGCYFGTALLVRIGVSRRRARLGEMANELERIIRKRGETPSI